MQEVVDDPSGNKMLLVMDYMEGGPVMTREALERGRCIPESLACQYFRDMCKVSYHTLLTLCHLQDFLNSGALFRAGSLCQAKVCLDEYQCREAKYALLVCLLPD